METLWWTSKDMIIKKDYEMTMSFMNSYEETFVEVSLLLVSMLF
jgi:hypothetical protein